MHHNSSTTTTSTFPGMKLNLQNLVIKIKTRIRGCLPVASTSGQIARITLCHRSNHTQPVGNSYEDARQSEQRARATQAGHRGLTVLQLCTHVIRIIGYTCGCSNHDGQLSFWTAVMQLLTSWCFFSVMAAVSPTRTAVHNL